MASSKRSSEYESLPFNTQNASQNDTIVKNGNMPVFNLTWSAKIQQQVAAAKQNEKLSCVPQISMPTIIRPNSKNNIKIKTPAVTQSGISSQNGSDSPPMPLGPPPNPPRGIKHIAVPCALAIHSFTASQPGDLSLEENDIVYLLRRINSDWLYGRVADKEGMFPENFVDIQVPLEGDEKIVIALYEFHPQMDGDLQLVPGQKVKVIKTISDSWLLGESNGKTGQFPSSYVIPHT